MEQTLEFAGENRSELEAVLKHYKSDSLKLKAAEFLIGNMRYHFGVEKEMPFLPVYDANVITADYLIRNIDAAFRVWRKSPWGKHITFDDFCELILPYRIANEPITDWRKEYQCVFEPLLDTLSTSHDVVQACSAINGYILNNDAFHFGKISANSSALELLKDRSGGCVELTQLVAFAARSVGIPVGIDMVLVNPNANDRHQWNFIKDTTGSYIAFSDRNNDPIRNLPPRKPYLKHANPKSMGKIYRRTFSQQTQIRDDFNPIKDVPEIFRDPYIKDVSPLYLYQCEVEIVCDQKQPDDKMLYLAVFNHRTWQPVTYAKIVNKKATFNYIEPEIVYLPVYYRDKKIVPAGTPLYISSDGKTIHHLVPDRKQLQRLTLTRKIYVREKMIEYMGRMVGGIFQGANNRAFSRATTLHRIDSVTQLSFYNVHISNPSTFKYVRYLSPGKSYGNVAEIEFYTPEKEKLTGTIIGTEGSYNDNPDGKKEAAFDGDLLTFFDSKEADNSWVGMEFSTPRQIGQISFLSRNDDNSIRPGDTYELSYMDTSGWVSMGKQVGDRSQRLIYDRVPSNALYWLHNLTRGVEERIFTYSAEKQIWW